MNCNYFYPKIKFFVFLIAFVFAINHVQALSWNPANTNPVGIESANNTYHIWNSIDDYYINATDAVQITNYYQEYWTENKACFNLLLGTKWRLFCGEAVSWSWAANTDNNTYANLTGTTSVSEAGYGADIALEYYLVNTSENLKITLKILNTKNKRIDDSALIINIHNIRINNDTENDFIELNKTTGIETYNLSNPSLNIGFSQEDLVKRKFKLYDENYVYLIWNESIWINSVQSNMNYTLNITHNSEYNAPVNLTLKGGPLEQYDLIVTNFQWGDPRSLANISIPLPSDPTSVEKGETFEMTCEHELGGRGRKPDITVYWEYCEGLDCTSFQNIPADRSSGLGDTVTENPSPKARTRITHLIEAIETGTYEVRCRGYDEYSLLEKTSKPVTINVNPENVSLVEDWTMLGGDETRKGWSLSFTPDYSKYPSTGLVDEIPILEGEWFATTPVVKNNVLYATSNMRVYSYDLANEEMLWNVSFEGNTWSTPAVSAPSVDGDILCYGEFYNLVCRNATNGNLLWNYNETAIRFDFNSPVIKNEKVWIGSRRYGDIYVHPKVYSFDLKTGALLSKYDVPSQTAYGSQFTTDPAISDGIVYIGTVGWNGNRGYLLALNESTGTDLIWSYPFSHTEGGGIAPWFNVPSISKEKVFLALEDADSTSEKPSFLIALNKNDGSLIWRANMTISGQYLERIVPVVYAGKVIVASTDWGYNSYVYAFNESNGELLWSSSNLNYALWASPSVADGKVIIGSYDADTWGSANAFSFSSENGSSIWEYIMSYSTWSIPSIYNNKILIPTGTGIADKIYKFNTKIIYTNASVNLSSGEITVLNAEAADAVLEVHATGNALGTINIQKYLKNPKLPTGTFGETTLNKYISIKDPDNLESLMDWIMIRIYYTDDEINAAGVLDESSLKIYYWNETQQAMVAEPNSGVNIVENYVWANTTHFSMFGSGGLVLDSDRDGIPNRNDNCVYTSNSDQRDKDKDGLGDACDNCPHAMNGDQKDIDKDGIGNICDNDADNDGKANLADLCPLNPNKQKDIDNDGIGDDCDNCKSQYNPDQKDTDRDGFGDACDNDDDEDGLPDSNDNCPLLYSEEQLVDTDGDGIGDLCEGMIPESYYTWYKESRGASHIAMIREPGIGVTKITVWVHNKIKDFRITVTPGKPAKAKEPSGVVYQYVNFMEDKKYLNRFHKAIEDTNIENVTISFMVNKQWISKNKVSPEHIQLSAYYGNNWYPLSTRLVGEDRNFVYYEALSPVLATFAIVGNGFVATRLYKYVSMAPVSTIIFFLLLLTVLTIIFISYRRVMFGYKIYKNKTIKTLKSSI